MTGDVIRRLWPISLVLLPEAISRDARRLLCFRRQSSIHCKSLYISTFGWVVTANIKKKKKDIKWSGKIKKRKLVAIQN